MSNRRIFFECWMLFIFRIMHQIRSDIVFCVFSLAHAYVDARVKDIRASGTWKLPLSLLLNFCITQDVNAVVVQIAPL